MVVDEDGERTFGRAAIRDQFAASFQDHPGSTIAIQTTSLRFLGTETALEEGRATITPAKGAGRPEISGFIAIYVKEDGHWLQAAVRDEPAANIKPHDRLKELEWLIGEWVNESQDAVVFTTCKWADSGNFLVREFTIKTQGKPVMSGSQTIGWDPVKRQFKSWVFDSEGGFVEAYWTRNGNQWVAKAEGVGQDGQPASATNIITRLGKDRVSWQSVDRTLGGTGGPRHRRVHPGAQSRPRSPSDSGSASHLPHIFISLTRTHHDGHPFETGTRLDPGDSRHSSRGLRRRQGRRRSRRIWRRLPRWRGLWRRGNRGGGGYGGGNRGGVATAAESRWRAATAAAATVAADRWATLPRSASRALPPTDHAPREAGRTGTEARAAALQAPPIAIPMQTTPMPAAGPAMPIATRARQMPAPRPPALATPTATRDRPMPAPRPPVLATPTATRDRPMPARRPPARATPIATRDRPMPAPRPPVPAMPIAIRTVQCGRRPPVPAMPIANQGLDLSRCGWRGRRCRLCQPQPVRSVPSRHGGRLLERKLRRLGSWRLWLPRWRRGMGHGLTDVRLGLFKL